VIPDCWKTKRLRDCCVGKAEYGANASAIDYDESLPRYIRITDIDDNGFLLEDTKASVALEGNEKYLLKENDFLFARTGATVGKTYLYQETDGPAVYAGYLIKFTVDPQVLLPEYLKHYTETGRYWYWVRSTIHTGAQPNINAKEYSSMPVPVPPLPEQRRIVEILGRWDRAIMLVRRRIETARQRKKGLMQRLLTGRVRFPEFERETWQTVKLGEIFDERKERGYEELPLLSVTAEEGIIYRDELDRRDTSSYDKSNYLRVREGDVTYNTMRMWQGRSGVSEYEGIVSPAYTVCEPKPSIDVAFAGYLFQLPSVIYKFRRYSQGMVSDTWTLRFDNFAAIKVQIPSLEEQKKIAAVLQACDREIDLLEQKRDALQRQKKGLMQRLLTGRVRVEV
jgi:type I restriction enzyme S subunit